MKQDRIDQLDSVQVQSQDPIGVIASLTTLGTAARPQRGVASESGFEMAWSLAH